MMKALSSTLTAFTLLCALASSGTCAPQAAVIGILPKPDVTGFAPVDGVRIWYGEYGAGAPVILLHGGITNSRSWAFQIPALRAHYRVIVLDNRGHGRSSRTSEPFTYHQMASDLIALMDFIHVDKASLVGWSDGADIALDVAIHHPERVDKLFAYAGNTEPAGLKEHAAMTPAMRAFFQRSAEQYHVLSPTPDGFDSLVAADEHMASVEPHFSAEELASISAPTWIVGADHDQFIKRENTDYQARLIPGAGELILPGVTHGAPEEDPALFNAALLRFLAGT